MSMPHEFSPASRLMNRSLALANRRGTGRAFKLRLTEFGDPQARVNVVEIDQAVEQRAVAGHRAGLPSPGEWQIRTESLSVSRPEAGNFAPLAIEIAAQLAGNIEHPGAAAVVALIEHVVGGPEVVRAAFRHFILRHLP